MITIANRLRPFSHLPGNKCLIPGTAYVVQAFPALLRILDFSEKVIKEVSLDVEGPLKNFTLLQDLERGCVTVFSEKYHYHVLPDLEVVFKKNPDLQPLENKETLSLGEHKKQNWESVKKRCDFREIFPFWFRLGSLLPLPKCSYPSSGMFSLLEACKEAIDNHAPENILPAFQKLFLAGFENILIPRLQDTDYQGILPFHTPLASTSPLYLLTKGAEYIRSLFITSHENEIAILPNLPPEFFSGRLINILCPPYCEIDIEWTKKSVRKVVLKTFEEGNLFLHFPPSLKTFRLRTSKKNLGISFRCGDPLEIKSGSVYLLDQFQK